MTDKTALTGLIHEELEPRLLFSAGAETVLLNDDLAGTDTAIVETEVETETIILELEPVQQDTTQSGPVHEVVFIDAKVEDYERLVDDLSNKDNIDIYILDGSLDGIEQISAVLEHYQELDAIHLISHGNEQGLLLGDGSLDNSNIDAYSETISGWQSALNEQADLLIYGCDVASSEQGLALLDKLNTLTGTDIAASDDQTGQSTNGGDWELEYQRGDIESAVIFSAQAQADWQGSLAAPVISNLGGDVLNYSENDGAVVIDQPTPVTVSDGGAMNDFSVGSLVVGIIPPVAISEDVLSIRDQGTGAGQIGFDGTNVSYEGVNIGIANIGGGSNGIDLIVTFTGNPSETAVAALVQNITYEDTDTATPTMGARTVQFTLFNNLLMSDTESTTVNVSPVNDAPIAADQTVTTNEDSAYTFTAADFNYSDAEADPMASLEITSLETAGSLQLNGVDVTLNQVISKADIDAGNLKFTPTANANGNAYASFAFSVNDGSTDSLVSYTMSIDVTPQNDLPTATNNTIATSEDSSYIFSANDFNFTDIDGDSLSSIKVTSLESVGTLQLNGVDVTLNQVISKADIDAGKLSFTPLSGTHGPDYDSFDFSVNDGSSDSTSSYSLGINVSAVANPVGGITGPGPGTTTEPDGTGPIASEPELYKPEDGQALADPTSEESSPLKLDDTDLVIDIDDQGKPSVLPLEGNNRLLQPLLNYQHNSDTDETGQFSPSEVAEGENTLIDSTSPWQTAVDNSFTDLQMALDELNRQLGDNGHAEQVNDHIIITTAVGITIAVTTGFITWLLQGGSLLTALLTSLPAWHNLDPLPVLDNRRKKPIRLDEKHEHNDIDFVFDDYSSASA